MKTTCGGRPSLRSRPPLLTALGLAVGVALVVAVTASRSIWIDAGKVATTPVVDPSAMLGGRRDLLVQGGTMTEAQKESVSAAPSTPPEGAPTGSQ